MNDKMKKKNRRKHGKENESGAENEKGNGK